MTILENEYNGLNWRVKRRMDLSQGAYDGLDEERTYYYTASWQVAEERIDRDNDGTDDERGQQFWGVRYIDDTVAKRQDRDGDGSWTTASLDNWYYLTDVMFSVRGIADRAGNMHTRVDYTPYGVAMHRYAVDVNGDGSVNFADLGTFLGNYNSGDPLEPGSPGYDPDADLNGDGISGAFVTVEQPAFNTRYNAYSSGGSNPSPNTGWIDVPGDANGPDNSVGYDGYWFDVAGATDAGSTGLYCVRYRTYDPATGQWIERDPAHYRGGRTLYEYALSSPANRVDPNGLFSIPVVTWPHLLPPPKETPGKLRPGSIRYAPGFDRHKPWIPGNSNGITVIYNISEPEEVLAPPPPPPPPPPLPDDFPALPEEWGECWPATKPLRWWSVLACTPFGEPKSNACLSACGGASFTLDKCRDLCLCVYDSEFPGTGIIGIMGNLVATKEKQVACFGACEAAFLSKNPSAWMLAWFGITQ